MSTRVKSQSFAFSLLLAAGLGLSGCGDKPNDAATRGTGADTTATAVLTKTDFAEKITTAIKAAGSGHVDLKVDASGQAIKAAGDLAFGSSVADTAAALTLDLGALGNGVELRLVDQVVYVNLGALTDSKFAKIDLTDTSGAIGKKFGDLLGQGDPTKQIEALKDALKSFEKSGDPVTIDGVKAQPYVITIDTSELGSKAPTGGRSAIPKTIVVTMFVGPDNLPRRLTSDTAGAKVVVDFSGWGDQVDIQAPAAGDISDKDFFSQLGLSQLGQLPTT